MVQINTDSALMAVSSGGVLLSAGTEILSTAPGGGVIALLTLLVQAFIVFRQTRSDRRKVRKIEHDEVKQVVSDVLNERKNGNNNN